MLLKKGVWGSHTDTKNKELSWLSYLPSSTHLKEIKSQILKNYLYTGVTQYSSGAKNGNILIEYVAMSVS